MDHRKRIEELLTNRSQLLAYLAEGQDSEVWEGYLLADYKLGEFFQEQLAQLVAHDKELETALEKDLTRRELALEDTLWSPVQKKLAEKNWSLQESKRQILDQWKQASTKVIPFTFLRTNLPAAAGGGEEMVDLPSELLSGSGLPSQAAILCQRREGGYEIRLDSHVPMVLTMVFYQEDQELVRIKISEQIPETLLPVDSISGWTHIQLIKD